MRADNKTGKYAIEPQFDVAQGFVGGLASAQSGGKFGYIGLDGRFVIPPQFDRALEFSDNGLAPVKVGEKWGYINKTGTFVTAPQFTSALPFGDGFARVLVGERWGYVDSSAKLILKPEYEACLAFWEGLAPVKKDGKWGYIDKTGKFTIEPRFSIAEDFTNGLAYVDWGTSVISMNGTPVWNVSPTSFEGKFYKQVYPLMQPYDRLAVESQVKGQWVGCTDGPLQPPKRGCFVVSSGKPEEYAKAIYQDTAIAAKAASLGFNGVLFGKPDGTTLFGMRPTPDGWEPFPALGVPSFLLGFRGLQAEQSRGEVESVLRAQGRNMTCEAPEKDGSVTCKSPYVSGIEISNLGFSSEGKLFFFRFTVDDLSPPSTSQGVYRELANTLGQGQPVDMADGGILQAARAMGVKEFEWKSAGTVPCMLDREKDCPPQQLTLATGGKSATIELWDWEYIAKRQGLTKLDPNRPKPKLEKTIVLYGLKGGDSQQIVESVLNESGFSPLSCKHHSEDSTDECDAVSGNHRFSLKFLHGQLESYDFYFPKSEWDRQLHPIQAHLGEPTDTDRRTTGEVIAWSSERTSPCAADPEKQCPVETLMLTTSNDEADARVLYMFLPLVGEEIRLGAQRILHK